MSKVDFYSLHQGHLIKAKLWSLEAHKLVTCWKINGSWQIEVKLSSPFELSYFFESSSPISCPIIKVANLVRENLVPITALPPHVTLANMVPITYICTIKRYTVASKDSINIWKNLWACLWDQIILTAVAIRSFAYFLM